MYISNIYISNTRTSNKPKRNRISDIKHYERNKPAFTDETSSTRQVMNSRETQYLNVKRQTTKQPQTSEQHMTQPSPALIGRDPEEMHPHIILALLADTKPVLLIRVDQEATRDVRELHHQRAPVAVPGSRRGGHSLEICSSQRLDLGGK